MRARTRGVRTAIGTLGAALLWASLVACSSAADRAQAPPPAPSVTQRFADGPMLRGGQTGLECHWWITADEQQALARALGTYADAPSPIDAATLLRWRTNGFRIVAVPVDDLDRVLAQLPPQRSRSRTWLRNAAPWGTLITGRELTAADRVLLDGTGRSVPPGALRLIGRVWTSPTIDGPSMRLELVAQIETADAASGSADALDQILRPSTLADLLAEGVAVGRLTLDLALSDPAMALIVAPARPADDWSEIARRAEGGGSASIDFAAVPGPASPVAPTLGQAMLATTDDSGTPLAAVIVLIPRPAAHFSLIGAPAR